MNSTLDPATDNGDCDLWQVQTRPCVQYLQEGARQKPHNSLCFTTQSLCRQNLDLTLVPLENQQQQCNGQVSTQQHDQNSNIIADVFRLKTKGPQNGVPIHFHRGQLSPRYSFLGIWCEEEARCPMILIVHQSFKSVPAKHWGYCHTSVHAAL